MLLACIFLALNKGNFCVFFFFFNPLKLTAAKDCTQRKPNDIQALSELVSMVNFSLKFDFYTFL